MSLGFNFWQPPYIHSYHFLEKTEYAHQTIPKLLAHVNIPYPTVIPLRYMDHQHDWVIQSLRKCMTRVAGTSAAASPTIQYPPIPLVWRRGSARRLPWIPVSVRPLRTRLTKRPSKGLWSIYHILRCLFGRSKKLIP